MKTTKIVNIIKKLFCKENRINTLLGIVCWLCLALGIAMFSFGQLSHSNTEDSKLKATYQDDTVIVEATYGLDAEIPEEAELKAHLVTLETDPEIYEDEMTTAMATIGQKIENTPMHAIYHIGFFVGEEEVEPATPVEVTIHVLQEEFTSRKAVKVLHLEEFETKIIADTSVDENGYISFTTDSFSDFAFFGVEKGDMTGLLSSVTITTENGESIEDNKLYVDEKYKITLTFSEGGAQSAIQFDWNEDGTMTFQLPANFKIEPKAGTSLTIKIDGEDVTIGTYSETEDGKIIVELNNEGKEALQKSSNASISFEIETYVQAANDNNNAHFGFGNTGEDINFEIVDQAQVDVKKESKYTENEEKNGGKLEYTVTTTVTHGSVSGLTILDKLTPPQNSALTVNNLDTNAIKVTLKQFGADGTVTDIELKKDEDYELVEVEDEEHPGKKTFQIKLKDSSNHYTLNDGDALVVTYPYQIELEENSVDLFQGDVVNEVNVTGKGKVAPPKDDPDKVMPETDIDEHLNNSTWITITPPGNGIIFKTQEYSETDHKVHYTLYTYVPKGEWTPFYIHDDMVVEFGGEKYYISGFNKDGRVSGLKVSSVTVPDGNLDDWLTFDGNKKQQSLEELKKKAENLEKGYNFDDFPNDQGESNLTKDYNPESMEQWVYQYGETFLNIIFGFKKEQNGNWGHWNETDHDTLIITEYDLDMSNEKGPITLKNLNDTSKTITKTADEILEAGITNGLYLRFGGYFPNYYTYFNNKELMNKKGTPNKNDNTITYTVTLNTTDETINKYLRNVKEDLFDQVEIYNWGADQYYPHTMQAVFYDELPEGWEYVEGSLTATAINVWDGKTYHPYNGNKVPYQLSPVIEVNGKKVISAPLVFFYNADNKEMPELFNAFSQTLKQLTFTYQLKASDEWMQEHATDLNAVTIENNAEIRDNKSIQPHWTAESKVPYLPQHLSKTAEQEGDSNLLRFTLSVNPGNVTLNSDKGYLIVTDKSQNLEIPEKGIKVKDTEGHELEKVPYTKNIELKDNQWTILPETETGKFQLMVPDGKALLVTYDALIPVLGSGISISNDATIEGVVNSKSEFEHILNVNNVAAGGDGSTYTLSFEKVDSKDDEKKLASAKFKFYIIIKEGSNLEETKKITIGGKEYSCYSKDDWNFTTDDNGQYEIPSEWRLENGNYYILEELEAPTGYEMLEEPVLFYFGASNQVDKDKYPNATTALPGGTLTVANFLSEYRIPEAGGSGTKFYSVTGLTLMLSSGIIWTIRKHRLKTQ